MKEGWAKKSGGGLVQQQVHAAGQSGVENSFGIFLREV